MILEGFAGAREVWCKNRKGADNLRAKEYLKRLKTLDLVIRNKREELKTLRASLDGTGAGLGGSGGGGKTEGGFVCGIVRIDELERQINEEIARFVSEKHRIISEINMLSDPRYVEVLYKSYAEFKCFDDIATEMGYSYPHILRIHGAALEAFEKLLGNDRKC